MKKSKVTTKNSTKAEERVRNPFKVYKEKKEPSKLIRKTPLKASYTVKNPSKLENGRPIPKTKERPLKTSSKKKEKSKLWYRKKCDELFSKQIRAIGFCEWCGKTEGLQCSHVISRAVMPLRCEPLNAISLCYRCHLSIWHKSPLEASVWFNKKYPGRYDKLLELRNNSIGEKVDWKSLYETLKTQV